MEAVSALWGTGGEPRLWRHKSEHRWRHRRTRDSQV